MASEKGTLSGLSPQEAQELHKYFMQGFLGFVALTLVAHILIWMWRPWF